ncbi:ABC transporter ATP-binding protein [Enterococcus faecalis]
MQLENISKTIDKKEILTNISITVEPGEIVGLIGPNGAGKTTTMKIMSGLIVNFQGKVVGQERIGVLIDGPKYFPNRTARENLNYFRALSKESYSVDYVESLFDMKNYGKKKVKDFSLGMKQRLGMALALINKNELLILDEPMNGLDPDGVQATIQTLKHLAKELHIGIVISSHILGDLDKLCDRAYFIKNGAIIQTVTLGK